VAEKQSLAGEFKAFILRGNVLDLAVAVVIGVAFKAVVDALVKDLITPILAIPGKTDFGSLSFTIRHSHFLYGDFINNIVSFVSVALAVFLFVVKPVNVLIERRRAGGETDPGTKVCSECMSEIPALAKRCAYCTSPQPAVS